MSVTKVPRTGHQWLKGLYNWLDTGAGPLRVLTSVGHLNVGAVTLTGAKVGDAVVGISNVTDHATLLPTTDFEATITVVNQVQQVNTSDLSAKTLIFVLVAKS